MFGSPLPPVVCRRAYAIFMLFVFVCVQWCPTNILLCFCFVCVPLVYPKLPVSLDCPFLIVPSIFSNVYLYTMYRKVQIIQTGMTQKEQSCLTIGMEWTLLPLPHECAPDTKEPFPLKLLSWIQMSKKKVCNILYVYTHNGGVHVHRILIFIKYLIMTGSWTHVIF